MTAAVRRAGASPPRRSAARSSGDRASGRALRHLGLERLLFGSDFPVFDPREHARFLAERTGLTRAELDRILARRLPG